MVVFQNILSFIILLGGLVAVHELGHFWVAKLTGVKVLKFSIGFGPKLLGFKHGETEYVLAWIPLGGFVRMAGELPKDKATLTPEEEARSFLAQPWWKRAAIAFAGPAFNLIFPILVFFCVFYWGGLKDFAPRIGSVVPGLPAAEAGLKPGDVVRKIDGVPIQWFSDISQVLRNRWEKNILIEYERDGVARSTFIRPKKTSSRKRPQGFLGVALHTRPATLGVLPGSAAEEAGLKTFDNILELNGEPIRDEVALFRALETATSPLQLRVLRTTHETLGAGWRLQAPEVVLLTLPKQAGEGYAALGAKPGDLFVAEILPDSPAEKAGLQRGDFLLKWNEGTGEWTGAPDPVSSWDTLAQKLQELKGQPFKLHWQRGDARHEATLAQEFRETTGELKQRIRHWELGLRPQATYYRQDALGSAAKPEPQAVDISFGQAWGKALKLVPDMTVEIAASLGRLVAGKTSEEEGEADELGGPVMIFQVAAQRAEQGLMSYLYLMATLSVSLAILNLLPLPILDGFTVLTALWEGLWRKPLPMRFREIANLIGLVLLVLLMGYALTNDITRLLR